MATTTSLSADLRARLETTRRILGLSQVELSNMAGISQGNVSNCLQGRNVRIDSIRRLLSAFASAVAGAGEHGVSSDQARELQRAVEAARRSIHDNVDTQPYLARPGAPMPENAANRMERQEDRALLQALDDAPFTAAVVGPPECGKSTLLGLLAAEAQRRGFTIVEFDTRLVFPERDRHPEGSARKNEEEADPDQQIARFFGELAEEVALALGVDLPETIEDRLDFSRFLKRVRLRRPAPPLLIIVDHASVVDVALDDLAQVCRALDAHKGRTQMSWAIEASAYSEHRRLAVLSRLVPSPLVTLRWFDEDGVRTLAGAYGIDQALPLVQDIWTWFEGQPYLSHNAISRTSELGGLKKIDHQQAWQEVAAEVKHCREGFGQHINRLKASLSYHDDWIEFVEGGETSGAFHDACRESPTFRDLVSSYGLVMPGKLPAFDAESSIPKFYREHLFVPRQ